jgi:hypothetical protein
MPLKKSVHNLDALRQQVDELLVARVPTHTWGFTGPKHIFASEVLMGELVNAGNDIARNAIASYQVLRSQKGSQYDITLSVEYRESAAQREVVLQRSAAIVARMMRPSMSVHEKVLRIHDWVVTNFRYDHSKTCYTAYDGVVHGSTVCAGYAMMVGYLCEAAGIGCRIVTGNVARGPHAWNLVNIDGVWYHLDATWDSPHSDAPQAHDQYDYYLLTDSEMMADRSLLIEPGMRPYPRASLRYVDTVNQLIELRHSASGFLRQLKDTIGLKYLEPAYVVANRQALVNHLLDVYYRRLTHAIVRYRASASQTQSDLAWAWSTVRPQIRDTGVQVRTSMRPYLRGGHLNEVLLDMQLVWG